MALTSGAVLGLCSTITPISSSNGDFFTSGPETSDHNKDTRLVNALESTSEEDFTQTIAAAKSVAVVVSEVPRNNLTALLELKVAGQELAKVVVTTPPTSDSLQCEKRSEGVSMSASASAEWDQLSSNDKEEYKQQGIVENDTQLQSISDQLSNILSTEEFMKLVQIEENSTPTSELTSQKKKRFTPQGYVADMMEFGNIPESAVTSNNNPSKFLSEHLVPDTLKINKEISF